MLRVAEEANETEKNVGDEKPVGEEEAADTNKETPANETEEKEAEEKVIFFNSKHSQYLFLLYSCFKMDSQCLPCRV